MERPVQLPTSDGYRSQNDPELFSGESVLNILKLILAGAPLPEVLAIIAQLVEARGNGTLCTIWLPTEDGKELYCAAAPGIPGFITQAGSMKIGPKGGSCGTAVYRKEPVYVTDVLLDPIWDVYRHRLQPFGIRAVWSQPLFAGDGKALGTFAIHYLETRSPDAIDLQLIERASRIAGIAIERDKNEERLRVERDRLRLLLEITNSMASKLDMRRLIETLSTDLLKVTRCDFCALLLPEGYKSGLRVTTLYNPKTRGSLTDGMTIPSDGSICGKAFQTGKAQYFGNFEELSFAVARSNSSVAQRIFQCVKDEGLVSGCSLPLLGRSGVIGVLAALNRSERAFEQDEIAFLEQVSRQVALAV